MPANTPLYRAIEAAMAEAHSEGVPTGFPEHIQKALHHLEEARVIVRDAPVDAEPTTTPMGSH